MESEAVSREDPMDWRGDRQVSDEFRQILADHHEQIRDIIKSEFQTGIRSLERAVIQEQRISNRSSGGHPSDLRARKWHIFGSKDGPGPAAALATDQVPLPGTGLERDVDNLKVRLATAESQLDQARSMAADATHEQQNMKRKLFEEQRRVKELQEKVANLRGILTKGPSGLVLDGDVRSKFMEVRNLAHMVVRKLYSGGRISSAWDWTDKSRSFFEPFASKRIPSQYFENRLRGKVFDILDENLLSRPQFGLGREDSGLEHRLTQIEEDWNKLLVRYSKEMADWRLATLKCVELMKTEPDAPKETFHMIWDFMLPALTTSQGDEEKGRVSLAKLCEGAFSLAMMMRRSRDTFIVEKPPHRALLSEWTDFAEEFANEPAANSASTGKILFCLFGGLSKIPEEGPGAKIVLERAQVVVIGA